MHPNMSHWAFSDLPDEERQKFLTAPQLALLLQLHAKTVWKMARAGEIPRVAIGRRSIRFFLPDVVRALTSGKA